MLCHCCCQGSATIYNNPELEMLAKEIQSLLSEKITIEKELQDAEYQVSRQYEFVTHPICKVGPGTDPIKILRHNFYATQFFQAF